MGSSHVSTISCQKISPASSWTRAARDNAINQRSEVLIHGEDGRIRDAQQLRQ